MDRALVRLRNALAGRYRVERELGRGGMATVYLAQELKHDRPVAVKVLRPDLATAIGVERFLREITTATRLNHPHILAVHDSGEQDGLLYYVMPYIEGQSLRGRLEKAGPLPIDDALRIAGDVVDALAYAHSCGVVHRDIKPENILFSGGRAVVADFGIARAMSGSASSSLTADGAPVGTPRYMSPEQATGVADARSDQYSLACVLYEMLAGAPPFDGPTPQAILARHAADPVPPIRTVRATVPDAVDAAIRQALAKTAADRFATVAQFGEALRAPTAITVDAGGESIAVLPFENLSAAPDTDYFSDGITEEIINALAQVPGLRVAARASSFAFRGKAADIGEVGAKLRVATVLEGSVRRDGSRLRVTAQLIDVRGGFHLWSERYDREMVDVFAIQDEIARAIAQRVTLSDGALQPLVRPPTASLDAYHLYLKGRFYWAQRGLGLKKALEAFSQALVLDPNYALAHAGFADACTLLVQYGLAAPGPLLPKARAAVARALDLAPELAEAHCAAGIIDLVFGWDWAAASARLRHAIELNPRYPPARHWLATYLTFVEGRFDEGVGQARRAVELDPLASLPSAQLGLVLVGAGRYEEALAPLQRATELSPTLFLPFNYLGVLLHRLGRTEEAVAMLEHAVAISGRHQWPLAALAVCCSATGRIADVQAIHDELSARSRREYVMSSMLALLTAGVGKVDEAFALLERACDERDGIMIYSKRYPAFALLQADPRMEKIYRRIGLPA